MSISGGGSVRLGAISRTTAYRYFPTQRDLLVAAFPMIEQRSLLGDDPPDDVETRLDIVVTEQLRLTIANESALRTTLRLALEPDGSHHEQLVLRQGRVIGWLEDAFSPLRGQFSDQDLARLVRAIRSAVGIEALVWLCDVAGLSRDEAQELMRWSARALLRTAIAEAGALRAASPIVVVFNPYGKPTHLKTVDLPVGSCTRFLYVWTASAAVSGSARSSS
jgi:AcrR family transcriptional regulator